MHKKANILIICISGFILSSCARATDKTLSPPSDTQWVNVEVKKPSQYTKPPRWKQVINIGHSVANPDGSTVYKDIKENVIAVASAD